IPGSVEVQVTSCKELYLPGILRSVPGERRGVAASGMFTATQESKADHPAPPCVLTLRQPGCNDCTDTCCMILSTSSGSTRPGDSAGQLDVLHATARLPESASCDPARLSATIAQQPKSCGST